MMSVKKSSLLKLELLSKGIDFKEEPVGVGTKFKEEYRALFDARLVGCKDLNLPPELILPGGIVAKTIYRESSPYIVVSSKDRFEIRLKQNEKTISTVEFPMRPKFYSCYTSAGTPMKQVGQILGTNCLGIIINSYCSRYANEKNCKFCNIGSTTQKKGDSIRRLDEIIETAKTAHEEHAFSLINLTGGTFKDPGLEFSTYLGIGNALRKSLERKRLPGVSSINPPSKEIFLRYKDDLVEANFDMLTYNLEVWDKELLKKVCPGKHDLGGRDFYIDAAERTIDVLGKGHVGIIFTIGPWENVDNIIEGCEHLARRGILPIPVVFHPGKGAEYSWMGTTSVQDLLKLYKELHKIYQQDELIPSNRSRPAGSELSFRNSLINESCLGYLN